MATRITAGVIMPKVLVILLYRSNDVPFHDLHMVDVVEQFKIIAGDFFAEFDAPRGVVAHVVGMVDSAVQQLHIENNLLLLGHRHDLAKCFRAVL